MLKDTVNNKNESNTQKQSDIANVDKIREILFGNQMKDFEQKFNHLQEQLNKKLNLIKEDSSMRFNSLENFVKSEFESLNQRLDGEQKMRISELNESSEKLEKSIKLVSNNSAELERHSNDKSRELRQLLLEQSKELFEKMNQKQINDNEMINKFRDEMNIGKVDRSALSTLFTELALQLSGNEMSSEFLKNTK